MKLLIAVISLLGSPALAEKSEVSEQALLTAAEYSSMRCGTLREIKDSCNNEEDEEKQNAISQKITFFVNNVKAEKTITCKNVDSWVADCKGDSNNICKSAHTEMLAQQSKMLTACGKVDEDCKSTTFTRCNDYMRENGGSDELGGTPDLKEFLQACPYFARSHKEDSQTELDALLDVLNPLEDQIKEIQTQITEDKKDRDERMMIVDGEITKIRSEQKDILTKMDKALSAARENSSNAQTELQNQIQQAMSSMNSKANAEADKARDASRKAQLTSGTACYTRGFEAIKAEIKRLKGKNVSRKDQSAQVNAGGVVAWLKVVGNQAFNNCMKEGPIASGIAYAKEQEEKAIAGLNNQIKSMGDQLKAMQDQITKIGDQLPAELREILTAAMAEAESKNNELIAKSQERMKIYSDSQQTQITLNAMLSKLMLKNTELSGKQAKLKKAKAVAEGVSSPGIAKETDFRDAMGAKAAFESARIAASDACCIGNKLHSPTDGVSASICLNSGSGGSSGSSVDRTEDK